MTKREPLDLTHEEIIAGRIKQLKSPFSEYSFANLYLFRHVHEYKIDPENPRVIQGISRKKNTFFIPLCHLASVSEDEIANWLAEVDYIFPIDRSKEHFKRNFKWYYDSDESDYVYLKETIEKYSGRHLDGHRAFVRKFKQLPHRSVTFGPQHFSDALFILDSWQAAQKEDKLSTDYLECLEAIQLISTLKLSGRITFVDNEPVGFTLGEILSDSSFAIHFAKAKKTIPGIYSYLYQDLSLAIPEYCDLINFEQDMGNPMLKKSKMTYRPQKMLIKWHLNRT